MTDLVTVTDLYFPRDGGKVTQVRMVGGVVLWVDDNAPVVIMNPIPDSWLEQETLVTSRELALIEGTKQLEKA
jgi:hypothetical protein